VETHLPRTLIGKGKNKVNRMLDKMNLKKKKKKRQQLKGRRRVKVITSRK